MVICSTGDIAFRYLKYLNNLPRQEGIQSHVTISDINQNMLDVGKVRAEKLGFINGSESLNDCTVDWVCANAENLPFSSNEFTAYTIAFGIRNCTHIDKVCLNNKRPNIEFNNKFSNIRFCQKLLEFLHQVDDLCVSNLVT